MENIKTDPVVTHEWIGMVSEETILKLREKEQQEQQERLNTANETPQE